MINLLPPELKQEYRYARYNRQLARWAFAFVLAIAGVAGITGSGLLAMNNSSDSYRTQIASDQSQLAKEDAAGIQQQVTDVSDNLKLMVDVLSKEILFSKLLNRLGSVTPPNVILTNLSISQAESAVDITAQTTDYNAATQLQVNLADPTNQVFSKADLVAISCATGSNIAYPKYPCTASLRAQFINNNPFLFINSKSQATG